MKFGPVPLNEALGKILGHNITAADGTRALRKGRKLRAADLDILASLGRETVYVAVLEPDDVDENRAARRLAMALVGAGLRLSKPHAGRVNMHASQRGVLRVDADRMALLNRVEGITVATLNSLSLVNARALCGTVKIIPFAVPARALQEAEEISSSTGPVIKLALLKPHSLKLILSGSPQAKQRVQSGFVPPLQARVEALGSSLLPVEYVPLEDERGEAELAGRILAAVEDGAGMIVLAGETAIMDQDDIVPRAVRRAGGDVVCFGAPVDPGNLLMLAYIHGVPVMGAPGCVRSLKLNVVDYVLPALLSGDFLAREDIVRLGHGGLLADIPERPMPREG